MTSSWWSEVVLVIVILFIKEHFKIWKTHAFVVGATVWVILISKLLICFLVLERVVLLRFSYLRGKCALDLVAIVVTKVWNVSVQVIGQLFASIVERLVFLSSVDQYTWRLHWLPLPKMIRKVVYDHISINLDRDVNIGELDLPRCHRLIGAQLVPLRDKALTSWVFWVDKRDNPDALVILHHPVPKRIVLQAHRVCLIVIIRAISPQIKQIVCAIFLATSFVRVIVLLFGGRIGLLPIVLSRKISGGLFLIKGMQIW